MSVEKGYRPDLREAIERETLGDVSLSPAERAAYANGYDNGRHAASAAPTPTPNVAELIERNKRWAALFAACASFNNDAAVALFNDSATTLAALAQENERTKEINHKLAQRNVWFTEAMQACQKLLCPDFGNCEPETDGEKCACGFEGGSFANAIPKNRRAEALAQENERLTRENADYWGSRNYQRDRAEAAEARVRELAAGLNVAADALSRAASVWRPDSDGRKEFDREAAKARALIAQAEASHAEGGDA